MLNKTEKYKDFLTRKDVINRKHEEFLILRNNRVDEEYNGIFHRYANPVLTEKHIPPDWQYDFDYETNPFLMERLEVNTVFNAGAIEWKGKICLLPRIESNDVKSFFAVAESDNGIDNFRFWDYPIEMPNFGEPDTNVYDIRVVTHEDGWTYGIFCTERKDHNKIEDTSAALAQCGIARTKDLVEWERLPDIQTGSRQQRNIVLHPEFVDGKYAFYTRPMDDFINLGSQGGIGWGTCSDINNPILQNEIVMDPRVYHTVIEVKNGLGPAPIKTKDGWLHLAHGVRRTAAGLRYVLYVFMCDLDKPWVITHHPRRHFIAPRGIERVGDVSNVVFSNGWVKKLNGEVLIYYASSDTRMHVATTSVDRLLDYVKNTPIDAGDSASCVQQRIKLIKKNRSHV